MPRARARHILVQTEAEANDLKQQIADAGMDDKVIKRQRAIIGSMRLPRCTSNAMRVPSRETAAATRSRSSTSSGSPDTGITTGSASPESSTRPRLRSTTHRSPARSHDGRESSVPV